MPEEIVEIKKKKSFNKSIIYVCLTISLVSFVLGTRINDINAWFRGAQNRNLPANLQYSELEQVYDRLREKYDGQLDATKLLDGAKKGLVAAAGDTYSTYFTKSEAEQYMSDLDGTFSGIGAELNKTNSQLSITSVLDDSPAKKAGLLAGDAILKVNDQETSDWEVDKAVSNIRGQKGTTVKLEIARNQELKEFSIVRDAIIAPSVKYEITDDNIGYLRISRFADTDTVDLATKAATEFKQKSVKGVILDLRGNGGGYVDAAQKISSLWLADKVVVQEKRGDKITDTLKSGKNPILEGVKTIVLVDGGSASASEIVAGALHDNGAAELVGTKTFGKGSVQEIVELADGSNLKVTIAKWFTPKGKNITKEGIAPDYEIKVSADDISAGKDLQKDKAVEIIKN